MSASKQIKTRCTFGFGSQEEMKITKIFHGEVRTQSLNERKEMRGN
jgi:hypothetical protein